jgi:hypothetical protein
MLGVALAPKGLLSQPVVVLVDPLGLNPCPVVMSRG